MDMQEKMIMPTLYKHIKHISKRLRALKGTKLLPLVKSGDTYLTDQMIQMYSTYGDLATNDNKQPTLSEQNVIKLSLDCNKCLSSDVTYTQGEPQHGIKLSGKELDTCLQLLSLRGSIGFL